MALFKVLRGNADNLPTNYHDGWAYFTTDTHEFFIDYTDNDGNLQRGSITSPNTIPRLSDDGVYYFETLTSFIPTILYLNCGNATSFTPNIVYTAGKANSFGTVNVLQCV